MSAPLAGVHCPACGHQTVHVSTVDTLTCVNADCPDTQAAQRSLKPWLEDPFDVPVGAVVIGMSGTIAVRCDEMRGVALRRRGASFLWGALVPPLRVLTATGDILPGTRLTIAEATR